MELVSIGLQNHSKVFKATIPCFLKNINPIDKRNNGKVSLELESSIRWTLYPEGVDAHELPNESIEPGVCTSYIGTIHIKVS